MEYNTQNSKIINGEYGRHIQKMIEYAMGIKNRDLRNEQAKSIVRIMANLIGGPKDSEDFWHKLWDQLFVISDFQLDVDTPFDKPKPTTATKPKRLSYPKHSIQFRPYGHLMEEIIRKVAKEEAGEDHEEMVKNIAYHLKKQYLLWNRDSVNDKLIIEHLNTLSDGAIQLAEDFHFPSTKEMLQDTLQNNEKNAGAKKIATPAAPANNTGKKKKKKKKKKKNTDAAANNPNFNKNI